MASDVIRRRIGKAISVSTVGEQRWTGWILISWRSDGLVLRDIDSDRVQFIPWHRIDRVSLGLLEDDVRAAEEGG